MMVADDVVIVLTTIPDEVDEATFAEGLIHDRLAACVSVLAPMQSTYRWEGAVERARERQVLLKTSRSRVEALHEAVRARHPYALPEWLVVSTSGGSEAYLDWVKDCVQPSRRAHR